MSMELKKEVLDFLKSTSVSPYERFNKAFTYFKKHPSKNRNSESNYNRKGYSDQNLKNLEYDLKKLYEISDIEIHTSTLPVVGAALDAKVSKLGSNEKTPEDLASLGNDLDFLAELKGFGAKVFDAIDSESDTTITSEEYKGIREEFKFLDDASCPDVLFVLVGKRIRAYRMYQKLHAQLEAVNNGELQLSEEEKLQLTKEVAAAYAENRACYAELNYYEEKHDFLGKHPLFRESNLKKEVDLMSSEDLLKFNKSSIKFFHDQKKALEKYLGNSEKLEEINKKISDREYKLSLVNSKLGVHAPVKK